MKIISSLRIESNQIMSDDSYEVNILYKNIIMKDQNEYNDFQEVIFPIFMTF